MDIEKKTTTLVPIIVLSGLGAAILLALFIVASRPLNETESVLIAILLSAASMLGSWLVTNISSQRNLENAIGQATEANKENIKNYAEKAAEKVLNLTNELSRLSDALTNLKGRFLRLSVILCSVCDINLSTFSRFSGETNCACNEFRSSLCTFNCSANSEILFSSKCCFSISSPITPRQSDRNVLFIDRKVPIL